MAIHIEKLAPFGCRVAGIDFEQVITPADQAAIRAAWVAHGIAIFPEAGRSEAGLMQLSRCFGELQQSATKDLNSGSNPFLLLLEQGENTRIDIYEVEGKRRTGWLGWHWDQTFMPEIVRGAVLRAVQPAPENGETGFIHAGDAYDRLSPAMQRRIEGKSIVYIRNGAQEKNRFGFPPSLRVVERDPAQEIYFTDNETKFPATVHPLVITHPESGRKILKLSPMHARYVLDLPVFESDALLTELAVHLADARFAHFHKWQPDDMVAWDNWSVIHSAQGVAPGTVRRMQRTTIIGDYKMGRYLDATLNRKAFTTRVDD